MMVLDTNVVSDAMKPDTNPAAMAWLNAQAAPTLYLSSVTLVGLLFGIAGLRTVCGGPRVRHQPVGGVMMGGPYPEQAAKQS